MFTFCEHLDFNFEQAFVNHRKADWWVTMVTWLPMTVLSFVKHRKADWCVTMVTWLPITVLSFVNHRKADLGYHGDLVTNDCFLLC